MADERSPAWRTGIQPACCMAVMPHSKADETEGRLIRFAIDIVAIVGQLPPGLQGKHIAGQLLRSGTAAAPNYAEARAAESRGDFIHKLKIALKELNETAVWLRALEGSFPIDADVLNRLLAENKELCRMMVASIQTARRNDSRQAWRAISHRPSANRHQPSIRFHFGSYFSPKYASFTRGSMAIASDGPSIVIDPVSST